MGVYRCIYHPNPCCEFSTHQLLNMAQTFYVNPTTGSDSSGAGSQSQPFKTIAFALKQATSGSTIQLASGNYNAASGEVFPLAIPQGVSVIGNETNKGNGISIEGSGTYPSPTFANQNVTFILANNAYLGGVTVTNPATRGTAVWIESTNPTIANSTFSNSKREGIFATGTANPTIVGNVLIQNDANGISIARDTKGEIRGNTLSKTGYGISIGDKAAPKVIDNKLSENRSGILISGSATPTLRNNISEKNEEDGVVVITNAIPDLGNSQQPGGNILRLNGQFDLHNATTNKLLAWGNQIDPKKIQGSVDLGQVSPPPPPDGLTDIANHWAFAFIQPLVNQGIIQGFPDRTFKPDALMKRSEYAALLVKAFNPPAKRTAIKFTDVADTFWASQAIQQAYRGEFLTGFPDKTFKPNDNVQRVQVIVSLVNGLGLTGGILSDLNVYDDGAVIPDYGKDEVATATRNGLVVNYPNLKKLNPTRDATRAEVAAILYQALVDAKRMPPITSPYIVSAP